nr:adult-specific protein A1 [Ischnura senegalensis]
MKLTICTSMALAALTLLVSEVSCKTTTEASTPKQLKRMDPICFEMLGCITTSEEWYSIQRPINPNPSSREEIGTTFNLYTRQNNNNAERLRVLDNGNIESRFFDPKKDTKFIIHGFGSSANEDWVVDMRQLLLKHLDVNVITVDWSKGASAAYPQAVSNTRVVGLEVANMVNSLMDRKGGSASGFHLIGHSLGAHTAGYAGERIPGLRRITGLDPAGPLFKQLPTFVRLDASDAMFVDVIHSDAELLGYGIQDISGHVDFFPNGGYRQPGAEVPGIPRSTIPDEIAEDHDLGSSHGRAVQLYLDSIRALPVLSDDRRSGSQAVNSCSLIGFPCESYEAFLEGNCTACGEKGEKCPPMGINADTYSLAGGSSPSPLKFYLKTNAMPPFCGHHYSFKLTLAKNDAGKEETAGELAATLTGDLGTVKDMPLTESGARMLKKGETYSFLGYNETNTGNIEKVAVTWKWNPKILTKVSCLLGCVKDLYVSNFEVTNLGYSPSKRLEKAARGAGAGAIEFKNGESTVIDLA